MPDDSPLLKTAELAKQLGIPSRTLQRWRREGAIKPRYMTPGGQALWVEADVRQQLQAMANQEEE